MLAFSLLVTPCLLHATFPAEAASSLSERWKPQVVGDRIVSMFSLSSYAKARIDLGRGKVEGAFVQLENDGSMHIFLFRKKEENVLLVDACLWSVIDDDEKVHCLHEMQRWVKEVYPEVTLLPGTLHESDLWWEADSLF